MYYEIQTKEKYGGTTKLPSKSPINAELQTSIFQVPARWIARKRKIKRSQSRRKNE